MGRRSYPPISPGDVCGAWTVLEPAPPAPSGHTRWKCRCRCGRESLVFAVNLRRPNNAGCSACNAKRLNRVRAEHVQRIRARVEAEAAADGRPVIRWITGRNWKPVFPCTRCGRGTTRSLCRSCARLSRRSWPLPIRALAAHFGLNVYQVRKAVDRLGYHGAIEMLSGGKGAEAVAAMERDLDRQRAGRTDSPGP